MAGNRLIYSLAIISIGIATLISYINPLVMKVTIDSVIGDKSIPLFATFLNFFKLSPDKEVLISNLWLASIVIILATIINGLFSFISGKYTAIAAERSAENIRNKLYNHIQRLPFAEHIKAETGDLIQRCTSDVETVRKFIAIQLIEVGRVIFMLALAIPVLFYLNQSLALISLIIIPIIVCFSFLFFIKVQKAFLLSDESEGRLSNVLQENLTGVRVVRAFAREKKEMEKFDQHNVEFRDLTYNLIKILAGYWSVSDLLCMAQIAVILIAGTFMALSGTISIGTLVAFLFMENMILWPVRQMGRILADMGKALVSMGRIQEILEKEPENMQTQGTRPKITGNIRFKQVSFSYTRERKILQDISFTVQAGMTVAIIGPTGSGKTTLLHLLQRLYDYDSGSITINGVELKSINKVWLRKNLAVVLQNPFLYAGSIEKNITLTKLDYTREEMLAATKDAAVHRDIENFNDRYATLIGEKGITLSEGQKQRVAIARALISNAPIVIFDDSLSAVDNVTEATINRALKRRNQHATTFVIAHRLTTVRHADLILVIDKGRVVQSGTHQQLINQKGFYQRVWSMQNPHIGNLSNQPEALAVLQ